MRDSSGWSAPCSPTAKHKSESLSVSGIAIGTRLSASIDDIQKPICDCDPDTDSDSDSDWRFLLAYCFVIRKAEWEVRMSCHLI
jgi:hypothetical protein